MDTAGSAIGALLQLYDVSKPSSVTVDVSDPYPTAAHDLGTADVQI